MFCQLYIQFNDIYLVMVSLRIGLRYEVSVEVEVDDDVLAGLVIHPRHGQVVCMASFLLLGVARLNLGEDTFQRKISYLEDLD